MHNNIKLTKVHYLVIVGAGSSRSTLLLWRPKVAQQHQTENKPNFKSNKSPSGGPKKGHASKGNKKNKYSAGSRKRGPVDMSAGLPSNSGPCISRCGHCVTCVIYAADQENARRISRSGVYGYRY